MNIYAGIRNMKKHKQTSKQYLHFILRISIITSFSINMYIFSDDEKKRRLS